MATKPFFRRRKSDPFEGSNAPKIDYKDTRLLQRYISERGKIVPVPHHRRLGQEPARPRPGDQARPVPGPAALCREIRRLRHASDPSGTRGQAWPDGRGRGREARLRAQLPAAAGQGAVRVRGQREGFRGPQGPARGRPTSRRRPKPRSWARSSTGSSSSSSAPPPIRARSTAPSPPVTRPRSRPRTASRRPQPGHPARRRSRILACTR